MPPNKDSHRQKQRSGKAPKVLVHGAACGGGGGGGGGGFVIVSPTRCGGVDAHAAPTNASDKINAMLGIRVFIFLPF
jgi:hypothetical protein